MTATTRRFWSLHYGRSLKPLAWIVPDAGSRLYQIEWPDIGLSDLSNLTRCKDAALAWAERKVAIEDRKRSGARRLKSLNNFRWSSSLVRQIKINGAIPAPEAKSIWSVPSPSELRRAAG
jgi:hypothetical protein